MNRKYSIYFFVVLGVLSSVELFSQSSHSRLLFRPLIANPFEPRIGTMYQASDNRLRLDIGNSFDLVTLTKQGVLKDALEEYNIPLSSKATDIIDEVENTFSRLMDRPRFEAALGADFFTYTRLRSEGNLKFPVETIDYLFGINGSLSWRTPNTADHWSREISARIRVSHISAHLADGLASGTGQLQPMPFIYSREFVDALGSIEFVRYGNRYLPQESVRLYAGSTIIFSQRQLSEDIRLFQPQVGAEYRRELTHWLSLFGAYDMRLSGVATNYSANHSAQIGVIFPQENGYELMISGYWYSGLSIHGLFYNTRDSYYGVGFQVVL